MNMKESLDNMSTLTPTSKGKSVMKKTYAFTAINTSPSSLFTYTTNSKTAEKLSKININSKKRKIAETSEKPKNHTKQAEIITSDTEEETLTALHIAAKRVLQKILSRVKTEKKVEMKQALYHLKKTLKQVNVKSPLKIQLKQLNSKMNLLLCKQDNTIITTQKIADKAVKLAQEQVQKQGKSATTMSEQKQGINST